jgi:hypothetical protein
VTGAADVQGQLFQTVEPSGGKRDLGALTRQGAGRRFADTAAGSGYQGNRAFQTF